MRIILSKEGLYGNQVILSGEKAKYLISVLRCNIGDEVQVFDGEGSFYKSKISKMDNKKVTIDLLEKVSCDTESPLNLILVQGILKGEKMDMVIQKATELGIKEIIPAITERSQVRYTRKTDRWRKIVGEASRQSGRSMVPIIHEPIEFSSQFTVYSSQLLKGTGNPPIPPLEKGGKGGLGGVIFWEEGGVSLKEAAAKITDSPIHVFTHSPIYVAIGPEGGFTEEEIRLAESYGLITVSLGKRILRAETAAISAITLIQFLMGDIG
jgi:16S rRNA (uracil1498-N3)-methyltransferase